MSHGDKMIRKLSCISQSPAVVQQDLNIGLVENIVSEPSRTSQENIRLKTVIYKLNEYSD
jgi:hypothetical protein